MFAFASLLLYFDLMSHLRRAQAVYGSLLQQRRNSHKVGRIAPSSHDLAESKPDQLSLQVHALAMLFLAFNPAARRAGCSFVGKRNHRSRCLSHLVVTMQNDGHRAEEQGKLDFQKMVDSLKADSPRILHVEPSWDIFADDLRLIYQSTGARVDGLQATKLLLKKLRRIRTKLNFKDDVRVDFTVYDGSDPLHRFPFIVARWAVKLRGPLRPFYALMRIVSRRSFLALDAQTVFEINDKNQIDSVRINKWTVNGQEISTSERWMQDFDASDDSQNVDDELAEQSNENSHVSGPLLVFTSELCIGHDTGNSHESPSRIQHLISILQNKWRTDFDESVVRIWEPAPEDFVDVTDQQLLRVHSQKHLENMKRCFFSAQESNATVYLDGGQTEVSPGTQAAVLRSIGLVIAAVDALLQPCATSSRAFVMVRPPGHHAERDAAKGFCLFNNIMVGVAHAEAMYKKQRIAVLDFDVHHGNGLEDLVRGHATRLFASSHESPLYPKTGANKGRFGLHNEIINAPLPAQSGSEEFRRAWSDDILPAVTEFGPDMVFIAAGFDAHRDDPLSSLCLDERDYKWVTEAILEAAPGVPVVSVLEGGYNVEALGRCVQTHVEVLAGDL